MTPNPGDRRQRRAALLEEAFDSSALAFSESLLESLEAAAPEELSGQVRSEQGAVYEIERKLARGGMATVYLAHDPKHDRPIAIKVLHAELTERVGAERFVREIRLTARLQHPHVLGLLDSGVFDRDAGPLAGRPYYVMPYVEGESLRARLAEEAALSLPEAMRVLREVADALSYAHKRGVVHRDIKPENILLASGHALVADFGIAKAIAVAVPAPRGNAGPEKFLSIGFARSSTLFGTPAYMAPEQAAGDANIDHRADLYAWGVVAYEILAGRHPFSARQPAAELLSAHVTEAPHPLRDVAPSVPHAVGALVMRCLAKAPSARPGSAEEVVAALDAAAIGAQTESRPARSPRVVMTTLAMLLVVGAGILYARMRPYTVARTEVVGTGKSEIDVAAVQSAVDHSDTVILSGTFSFRRTPTKLIDPILASREQRSPSAAEVLVSRAVTISGVADTLGGMATIDGGTIPFYVDAPDARVTMRGLRFLRPIKHAILVHAAHGLEIASNRVEGLVPFGSGARSAIVLNTAGDIPDPTTAERPDRVSGALVINQNDIDVMGGTAHDPALGVVVWSVGQSPHQEVTLDIVANTIRNTTSSGIMVRRANGGVRILGNIVTTSHESADYEAVRLVNSGSYLMAHNTINCNWPICVGISVFSQWKEWPIQGAIIEDNQVNMLSSQATVPADSGAAIEIKGFARSNIVRYNTIRGRARAGLAVEMWRGGYPEDNAFIENRLESFLGSVANVFVGSGAVRTRLVNPGTVVDRGEKTSIER